MGRLITIVIAALVLGYAAWVIFGVARRTKAGECSGCGHCDMAAQCRDRRQDESGK